jgi:translation initiation factor IF-3
VALLSCAPKEAQLAAKRKKTAGRKTVRSGPKPRPAAKSRTKKKAAARPRAKAAAKPVRRAAPRPAARPAPAPARKVAPPARAAASGPGTPAADLLYVDPVKLALERRRQLILG